MTRTIHLTALAVTMLAVAACGGERVGESPSPDVPQSDNTAASQGMSDDTKKAGNDDLGGAVVTPGAPFRLKYQIIGTPVIGVPITIDLQIESRLADSEPLLLEYRIRDASSMMFAESQPARVRIEPVANESSYRQQVTVIPQKEGRFYLNVSASFETRQGTASTLTAIPVQVGKGTRERQVGGEVEIDDSGESVRVLSGD